MDEIRLEVRARNNILWHAIFDTWPSVSAFCREHGLIDKAAIRFLLNLKRSPLNHKGEWNKISVKLAQIFGILPEELFPLKLYEIEEPQRILEISFAQLPPGLSIKELPAPNSLELDLAKQSVNKALGATFLKLSPKEEKIIRLRFGLEADQKEHTLEEIAVIVNVSHSRVGQIIAKSLRKMRHWGTHDSELLELWEEKLKLESREE
jgi:RNA polymerase sigma factor (sigma-70 family)